MSFLMDLLFTVLSGAVVNLITAAGTVPLTLFTELFLMLFETGP